MQTAAAYIRVSDARQDEYSPDSQLKLIRDYAAKNGYFIPDEFVFYDDGISGATASKRPEFNKMIGFTKEKDPPFTAILVWKFSRFARNQEESIVFKNMLKKNGISVVSVSEPISDDPFGGLIERIIEWMDEYYLIRLAPEVRRGMTEKASRGEPMAQAAFGYIFDKVKKNYFPNPKTAPALVNIFESYVSGEGMRSIAARLNAAGYRSIKGNPFDNRGIEYILNNPVYIGKIRWSPEGRRASKRDYSAEGIIIVDGTHEPLISEELWTKTQSKLKEQKMKYTRYQRSEQPTEFMLKGLCRCSACGATLVHQALSCPSLQCHSYAKGACKTSHSISIAKANRLVIEAFQNIVAADTLSIVPEPRTVSDKITPDYNKQISDINKKLSRLSEAYLSGAYSVEQFKLLKNNLETELSDITAKKEEAARSTPFDPDTYKKHLASVLAVISSETATESSKASALRTVVSSITYNKPSASLDLHFYF